MAHSGEDQRRVELPQHGGTGGYVGHHLSLPFLAQYVVGGCGDLPTEDRPSSVATAAIQGYRASVLTTDQRVP
jgi:hypothetical protein